MFEPKPESTETALVGVLPAQGVLERLWRAVEARDASGTFLYGVTSTGIYCRPGCASKRPKRENVCFFEGSEQAEAAGFRPCLRCTPNRLATAVSEQVQAMCRFIESASLRPSLTDVAACVGLSPSHAQRVFVAAMKLSPKQYYEAQLRRRLDRELPIQDSLLGAAHAAGFESKSQLYAKTKEWFGSTPSERRAVLHSTKLQVSFRSSSFGCVLVAESARGISAVLLGAGEKQLLNDLTLRFPGAKIVEGSSHASEVERVLAALEGTNRETANLPLDLLGTPFQVQVWRALLTIPSGETLSYAELAAHLGRPKATRAVASACAKNPIAVLVPCHRVLRGNGELGGYRWGLENKRALLEREAAHSFQSQRKTS